jgi:hypothetical protein
MKAPRSNIDFIRRYVNHLWKNYRDLWEVKRRLDVMMARIYSL